MSEATINMSLESAINIVSNADQVIPPAHLSVFQQAIGVIKEEVERMQLLEQIMVTGLMPDHVKGGMVLGLEGGMLQVMASCFIETFKGHGAENFLTMEFNDRNSNDRYAVTMQKAGGETPAAKNARLEARNAELETTIAMLRKELSKRGVAVDDTRLSKLEAELAGHGKGVPVQQEPKYTTNADGRLVNRATGKPIPDDEPVFVFRAKDSLALRALMQYRTTLDKGPHRDAVDRRIEDFERFMSLHPGRVRTPDTGGETK